MKFVRPLFFALFFLVVGFGVGRISQSKPEAILAPALAPRVSISPATTPTPVLRQPAASLSQRETVPASTSAPSLNGRAQTIAWLRKQDVFIQIIPVMGDTFNRQLVAVLDLTPAETERLDAEFKQTKQRIDAALSETATAQVSADRKKLIVTAPPAVAVGSAAYSNLVGTLKQVLGPERYQLFNEVTGNGFDHSFDSFGLNTVTYEVSLEPISNGSSLPPTYVFKQWYADGDNTGSGWGSGTLDRTGLAKSFPVITRFLTPDIIK